MRAWNQIQSERVQAYRERDGQLSASSADQLLKTMVDSAYLLLDPVTKRYWPSFRAARFGDAIAASYFAPELIDRLIERTHELTGELVGLFTSQGSFMQVIGTQAATPWPLANQAIHAEQTALGLRLPLDKFVIVLDEGPPRLEIDPSLGGVTGLGLKLSWKPLGPEAVRVTGEENVSIEFTVIDVVAVPPTIIVIGAGALNEKSGTITRNEALSVLLLVLGSLGDAA